MYQVKILILNSLFYDNSLRFCLKLSINYIN
jgi:hypothetical protein